MNDTPARVAAYVRVSTDKQASDEHFSIPEQKSRIESYCAAKGWNLVKIYTDPGYSGKSLDRPAMKQLIAECKQYDIVLVNKLDRLSRSQKDTLYLIEDVFGANGVSFVSMSENFDTTTPLGMAMVGILSTFAQLEREQIKERMMTGQKGRAKKGLFHGSCQVPVGYAYKDGHLLVDDNADYVREVYELFNAGWSLHKISRHMKETAPPVITWKSSSISLMIQNPIYIGKMKYRDEVYDGEHEPIIDTETFEAAKNRYALMCRNHPYWQNPSAVQLLSGLIWCGTCGGRYGANTATSTKNNRRYTYHYYQCYDRRTKKANEERCENNNRYRSDVLDDYIMRQIENLSVEKERKAKKIADHSKEITRLESQKSRLIDLYAIGNMDVEVLTNKIAAIDAKLAPLVAPHEQTGLSLDEARKLQRNAATVFAEGDVEKSRQIISTLVKRIVIYPDAVQIEWNF